MMVTLLAWIAHKLVSSNKPTKYASDASCNAKTAEDWNRKSSLEILRDFSDQALERQLSDEQIPWTFGTFGSSQRDGTRAVSVRLLDATSRRRRFARGLSRELLSRGFATGGFTSSLFGTSHVCFEFIMRDSLVSAIHLNQFKTKEGSKSRFYVWYNTRCITDSYESKLLKDTDMFNIYRTSPRDQIRDQ